MRHRYRLWGMVLESSRPLPEAGAEVEGAPDLTAAFEPPAHGVSKLPAGAPPLQAQVELVPGGVRIVFPDTALVECDAEGRRLLVRPEADVPDAVLNHAVLDHAIPRVLAWRGEILLHASAVVLDDGCACFVGTSGAGKSTLARAFAEAGRPVLSDDGVRVVERAGDLLAIPSYPGIRLWEEGNDVSKRRHREGLAFTSEAAPLRAVYELERRDGGSIEIEALSGAAALILLTRHRFVLDPRAEAHRLEFERLAASPLLGRCRRLAYPEGHANLAAVLDAVLGDRPA